MLRSISIISDLIPIIFFLLFISRNKQRSLWVIFVYTVFSFGIDVFAPLLDRRNIIATDTLNSVFTIIEYSLFSYFLFIDYKSPRFKQFIIIGSLVFFVSAIYNLVKGADKNFDSIPAAVESILIIAYCILYFYEQLKSAEDNFVYSSKKFWIVIAILLYLAATFILFISTAYMSEQEREAYWPINQTANIVKNLLIALAFIFKTRQKNKPSLQKTYNI